MNYYSKDKKKFSFKFFGAKILVVAFIVLSGYSALHFFETEEKQDNINKELQELQEQIDEFENKNENLEQLSQYLQTDDFKEKKAKEKLNLVKEGEKVIIVKKNEIEKVANKKQDVRPEIEVERPNYYYWWHYFFGIKEPRD